MKTISQAINRFLDPTLTRPRAEPDLPSGHRGIYLGHGQGGPIAGGPEHHVLVLGPPRSGKTTRLVTPALAYHRGPAVVTSTKADIIRSTGAYRRRLGRCWYWDPSGTTVVPQGLEPLSWSPLLDCEIWDRAVSRAHTLATAARPQPGMTETHWVERAQALLAVLLHAATVSAGDLATLLFWLHRRELLPAASVLQEHGSSRAHDILQGLAHTEARELAGIFSTADSILAAYRSDAALNAALQPSFDPDAFAASSDTIYLVSPAATQAQHAPIVIALLDQIRTAVFRYRPRPPMLYALDEVANIAPLPDLPSTLAEGGSQGLIVLACLQDLSQARARWDKAADGFLTLFSHKLILPGIADAATLKAISTLAGDTDVPIASTTSTNTIRKRSTTTWTTQRRPRLPADQVAQIGPGTAILISGTTLQRVKL